jgi:phage protein U
VLPFHRGGLDSLQTLSDMARDGERFRLARGDGAVLGWYAVASVSKAHKYLSPTGVGYVVEHTVTLTEVPTPGVDAVTEALRMILSLFG